MTTTNHCAVVDDDFRLIHSTFVWMSLIQMKEMFTTQNGDRSSARNVAVIITDGAANVDRGLTVPYAIEARNRGVYIVTMAVGVPADMVMLHSIASPPTKRSVFNAVFGNQLMDYRDRLFMASCDGILSAIEPDVSK